MRVSRGADGEQHAGWKCAGHLHLHQASWLAACRREGHAGRGGQSECHLPAQHHSGDLRYRWHYSTGPRTFSSVLWLMVAAGCSCRPLHHCHQQLCWHRRCTLLTYEVDGAPQTTLLTAAGIPGANYSAIETVIYPLLQSANSSLLTNLLVRAGRSTTWGCVGTSC